MATHGAAHSMNLALDPINSHWEALREYRVTQEIAQIIARNATRIDLPKWLRSEPYYSAWKPILVLSSHIGSKLSQPRHCRKPMPNALLYQSGFCDKHKQPGRLIPFIGRLRSAEIRHPASQPDSLESLGTHSPTTSSIGPSLQTPACFDSWGLLARITWRRSTVCIAHVADCIIASTTKQDIILTKLSSYQALTFLITCCLLTNLRAGQVYMFNVHIWGLAKSAICKCEQKTTNDSSSPHAPPVKKLYSWLQSLHKVEDNALR